MLQLKNLLTALCASAALAFGRSSLGKLELPRDPSGSNGLQDIVTWDEYSLKIHGERVFIFSGEVHPYRIPVQSLYLDVFQKIKALGFNAVSFYTFWGLHEPKRGEISFEGIRDLEPFFAAAMKAGLYLIARPGPYINAETTAGGFPGWSTTVPGLWRTANPDYAAAWKGYIAAVGAQIAKNQITNGGPVILVQSENEYTGWPVGEDFVYEKQLLDALNAAGIVVPTTFNDAHPTGHYTSVDVWGYDSYPNDFDCSHPYTWAPDAIPTWFWDAHMTYAPDDPNAVYEFQGGSFDGWGGTGYDTCAILTGPDFERVFYKNEYAMSTTILNLYMIHGGANWGGTAYPGVYTSYDYGAAIAEDRTLREKYYEIKLQANFLKMSPAYLTTRPQNINSTLAAFTGNSALRTTHILDVVGKVTSFYVVRQADASTNAVQTYRLSLTTSIGTLSIPVIGGSLALNGKDSKIHVVDYTAGNTILLYSTGEIASWASIDGRDVILLYGNTGELHETAFKFTGEVPSALVVSGAASAIKQETLRSSNLVIQYITAGQTVVEVGDNILLYILERADAYQFWALNPPASGPYAAFNTKDPILVKGGYLLRSLDTSGGTLSLVGDLNSTTSFEIVAPAAAAKKVTFNGDNLSLTKTKYGTLLAKKNALLPAATLPDLQSITWKTANSLPELSPSYSDVKWTVADHTNTTNPTQPNTPVVLYAGDYGYHTGNILWRGHFISTGAESAVTMNVSGGAAFGYSVWLDETYVGSWEGDNLRTWYEGNFTLPALQAGEKHVLTVLQDHMGYNQDWHELVPINAFKVPRGILKYSFVGSPNTTVTTWKVTGNLGGESFADKDRGPLNEGGLYAERQGWHLPEFDDRKWKNGRPTEGISQPGVQFYRTSFNLDVPSHVDYPLALTVSNSTVNAHYRAQFYVNGWQFGKYLNAVGPQKVFHVPQGILNYNGHNTLAVSLWAHDEGGAKLDAFKLQLTAKIETSRPQVVSQPAGTWKERREAY